jgi:hypothetical protein
LNLLPAATLFIEDEPSGHGHAGDASEQGDEHEEDADATTATAATTGAGIAPNVLSIAALVIATIALVLAVARRRPSKQERPGVGAVDQKRPHRRPVPASLKTRSGRYRRCRTTAAGATDLLRRHTPRWAWRRNS